MISLQSNGYYVMCPSENLLQNYDNGIILESNGLYNAKKFETLSDVKDVLSSIPNNNEYKVLDVEIIVREIIL